MHRTSAALPEDEYLRKIGEIAYAVSYIECGIIYDLYRLSSVLPKGLDAASLEPLTTGQIAGLLRTELPKIANGDVREYISRNAEALSELAVLRNDLLHARPATHPTEGQRLLRVVIRKGVKTGEQRWIDDAWFESAVKRVNRYMSHISDSRPSFDAYPHQS